MRRPDFKAWFRTPDYAWYELFLIRGLFALKQKATRFY